MQGTPGATPRLPYRAPPTPPRASPPPLPSSPDRARSIASHMDITNHLEYPSRGPRRLPSLSPGTSALGLMRGGGVGSKVSVGRRRRLGRKTMQRGLLFCIIAGLIVLAFQAGESGNIDQSNQGRRAGPRGLRALTARWAGEGEEEQGVCRFVSPVEAYHRDLDRLNRIYPHRIRPTTFPDLTNLSSTGALYNTTIQSHFFSPTGHLVLPPHEAGTQTPHPIPMLLALGEKKWENLLARQSRTLEQAVEEYQRRYGRLPPKGFDVWWDFAVRNNLVLPDEYDRINLDLAPFFALPKGEMKRRMDMVREMPETFTIHVEDGRVAVEILDQGGLAWDGTIPRSRDIVSLLQGFAEHLPNMKATFSIFDQPQIYISWARRESLAKLGLRGEHTSHLQETDSAHVRLSRSCPPESHYRVNESFYEGRSFIYDNLEASDLCQNPYVIPLHGLTIEPHGHDSHPKPHTQLLPLFSLAKTSINSDILVTPLDQFNDKPGKDPKWESKTNLKLAWRGSSTGISMMTRDVDWRKAHRIRLHHFANDPHHGEVEFMVPDLGQDTAAPATWATEDLLNAQQEIESAKDLADFYYDMKLAGGPLQCADGDGTCSDMWREIKFAPYQSSEELNKHKFLLDIDGNGWSGRFRRLMSTNSMVIKTSLFTEWYQPHLIPWFMYVPAKLDFSDLTDILAFFRGTPKHPDLAFDETAKALAQNGQCFAKRMFRLEDLQAYMMRLFLEYARIAADEGVDMDFHLPVTAVDTPEPLDEAGGNGNNEAMNRTEETLRRISEADLPEWPLDGQWVLEHASDKGDSSDDLQGHQDGDQTHWGVPEAEERFVEQAWADSGETPLDDRWDQGSLKRG